MNFSRGFAWTMSVILALAAYAKVSAFEDTVVSVQQSHLLPAAGADYLIYIVAFIEVVLALMLASKITRRIGFGGATVLFCLFSGYTAWRLWQGIVVPCSCFGLYLKIPSGVHVALNILISGLCAYNHAFLTATAPSESVLEGSI